MNKLMTTSSAATSLVLKPWAGERRCAAPVQTVRRTGLTLGTPMGGPADLMFAGIGLSVAGDYARVGVVVINGAGADTVQAAVRIPAMRGIPPRRTPSRC